MFSYKFIFEVDKNFDNLFLDLQHIIMRHGCITNYYKSFIPPDTFEMITYLSEERYNELELNLKLKCYRFKSLKLQETVKYTFDY